jgi:hypothetical protein
MGTITIINIQGVKLKLPNGYIVFAGKELKYEVNEWKIKVNCKIAWTLKDKNGNVDSGPVNLDVNVPYLLTMNLQLAGSSHYILEASLINEKDLEISSTKTLIIAYTDPKIINADTYWSKQEEFFDQSELQYGHPLFFTILTHGLNGAIVKLEVYHIKNGKEILKDTKNNINCINGIIKIGVDTLPYFDSTMLELETFIVKVKSINNQIYLDDKGSPQVIKFNIKKKFVIPNVRAPHNLTPCKVGETTTCKQENGIISLQRIAINTDYDVCHDSIKHYYDYENFWVLLDKDVTGKPTNFHWMKKRNETITYEDYNIINDNNKPSPLPITISSEQYFEFKAIFKTIIPQNRVKIRALHRTNKNEPHYTFKESEFLKTTEKGKEFEVIFTSKFIQNYDPFPFKNTARHIPNFELFFEYSFNNKKWLPLGNAQFCLYLTWKNPNYKVIIDPIRTGQEYRSGEVFNNCIKKDKMIYESLLSLGCKEATQNKNKIELDEDIVMGNVFKQFKDLKIKRTREDIQRPNGSSYFDNNELVNDHGLGYWRNISRYSVLNQTVEEKYFNIVRGLRCLLKKGEARCGEFNQFLQSIFAVQGITGLVNYAITTDIHNTSFQDYILISKVGTDKKIVYFERKIKPDAGTNANGRYPIEDTKIPLKEGEDPVIYEINETVGIDVKTGNPIIEKQNKAKFGTKRDKSTFDLIYDYPYNSIFLVKGDTGWEIPKNSKDAPTQKENKYDKKLAQGNSNPVHFFWDHIFMIHRKKDGSNKYIFKYYDPSYGKVDSVYRAKSDDVLKTYAPDALEAVVNASIPKDKDGQPFHDEEHTKLYFDLFTRSFYTEKEAAVKFNYQYAVKEKMVESLTYPTDKDLIDA